MDKGADDNYEAALYELNIKTRHIQQKVSNIHFSSDFSYLMSKNAVLFSMNANKKPTISKLNLDTNIIEAITDGETPVWYSDIEFIYQNGNVIYMYNIREKTSKKLREGFFIGVPSISPNKKFMVYKSLFPKYGEARDILFIASINENWIKNVDLEEVLEYYPYNVQWVQ